MGPLPPPELIKGYENVLEGSADRIIKMAEDQSEHRRFIEKLFAKSATRNETIGLFFAFGIVMTAIIGGIFLIYNGKDALGLTSIITAIVGAATVFIIQKNVESKESEKNKKEIDEEE